MSRENHFDPEYLRERYYVDDALVREQSGGIKFKEITRSAVTKNPRNIAGWRSPSPYKCTVLDYSDLQGEVETQHYRNGQSGPWMTQRWEGGLADKYYQVMPSFPRTQSLPGANSTYRAEVECLLKVRDMSVNLLNTFAERQKSIDMIMDRTTRVYRAYKAAKRGKFRDAASILGVDKRGKKSAKSWLELQYGWLPLLSDIHGGYEFLTGRRAVKGTLFKVSRTITDNDTETISNQTASWSMHSNVQTKMITKVVLWYTVEYEALAEASKLGLLNPLEVAWELTPWSFVVDWFLPIGNVLGALSATSGCSFKGGTLTRVLDQSMQTQVIPRNNMSGGDGVMQSGQALGYGKFFKMDRQVYTGSPFPVLYVKNPLSVSHALNAVALIRSLVK